MSTNEATAAWGWFGSVFQLIGVFGLSTRMIEPALAFQLMLGGSIIWVAVACKMRVWSMVALNAAFTLSNVIGLVQWTH